MSAAGENIGKAVKDFLAEAEEIVDQLNNDLVNLGDCADSGDCNPDLLNSIFRGAHSPMLSVYPVTVHHRFFHPNVTRNATNTDRGLGARWRCRAIACEYNLID